MEHSLTMAEISVVVPVYNVEKYLTRCIQSVMDQSYQGPIECVVVDDCGTDDSMRVLDKMLNDYHGPIDFKVIHHNQNKGLSAARNTGLDISKGEYVYFLDSDDAMDKDCLLLMVAEVEKHPGIEMVMGAHEIIREGTDEVRLARKDARYVEDNRWIRYHFFKKEDTLRVVAWNKLIKKSFLLSNGLRFKEGIIHEDEHFSFYCYRKLVRLSVLKDVTYRHYLTPNSIMSSNTNEKRAEAMRLILEDITQSFDSPMRSLQVYKYLLVFLQEVYPFVSKNTIRNLYFRFVRQLLLVAQIKIAFYLFVNWSRKVRFYQLCNQIIPGQYQKQILIEAESFTENL